MAEKLIHNSLSSPTQLGIGIDQSLTGFGFSAVSVDDHTQYFSAVYKSPYSGVQRLADIDSWLCSHFMRLYEEGHSFADVAMEGTVLASQSALVLGELSAVVKMGLYTFFEARANTSPERAPEHMRTPLQVPPMTLKKYATGKGTSKKNEMLLRIYQNFGESFDNDNAADAYALGCVAAKYFYNDISAAVIKQLDDPKYRDAIQ